MKTGGFHAIFACLVLLAVPVPYTTSTASAKVAQKPSLPIHAQPSAPTGLSEEQLAQARKLCLAKCARCHQLYHPSAYSAAEWQSWMTKMSRKARLKQDQAELVSRYLAGFRPASGHH